MSHKFLSIKYRQTLENIEEFVTMLSFNSDLQGVRILSIETLEEATAKENAARKANAISIATRRRKNQQDTNISKELHFYDVENKANKKPG